ncbi:MAG: amino acid adenylation domain-containing protein [Thermoanaerobaculia bacterium]
MSDISTRLAGLSPRKRELLLRQLAARQAPGAAERIPRQARDTNQFPLSFSQLREWLLELLDPGTPAYNLPGGARVLGALDLDALRRSVGEIVRRHESLRTTFQPDPSGSGEPVQIVSSEAGVDVPLLDLSALPPAVRDAEAARLIAAERRLPFDLGAGPLLRFFVLRLGPEDHLAPFSMHHIVSDGWSIALLYGELVALYEAFSTGAPSPLPELPVQYADFAVWQRERLKDELLEEQVGYWRDQLAGVPPLLPLPIDRPRPRVQRLRGAVAPVALGSDLIRAAKALGQREGASLFMVLLAAFQALLARWTGEDDVPVGTFSGNRGRAELEKLIGFFINTLVLRTRLEESMGFASLVARVRDVTLGAFAHQEVPFEKLLEELRLDRDLSHTPLFQALFVLHNYPLQAVELSRVRLAPLEEEGTEAHVNFDLELILREHRETDDEVLGVAGYNAELFDAGTIERLCRHLKALLAAALREPERPVHELPLLDAAERDQLLTEWSGAAVPLPEAPPPIPYLFSSQAARTPDAIAVEHLGLRTTYRELEERSNRLARHLRSLGVGPETVVGIAADRSLELIAGLLAVLKAGGAYLPLDPAYPPERLTWMLADSGAALLLTRRDLAPRWPEARAVFLEDEERDARDLRDVRDWNPGNAAYVLYTSGSTGRPKGVVVEHRSLAAYVLDAAAAYGLGPGERALQLASVSFDTSAEEIYPALVSGATLVLRPESMLDTVPHFLAELERLGITVLNLPTAYWHTVAAGIADAGAALPRSVRRVIIGGEQALPEALVQWRRGAAGHPARLVNTYGPTETTIVATRQELPEGADAPAVPIGRPIAGARVYVVDRHLQPVPPGVAGELLVGGVGIARGYLGRPELTASSFIPDPFGTIPGDRLYRTGDFARYQASGALEFLGRIDGQVKIRGFRVETGEIESVLTSHPGVHAAAVVLREDDPGASRLVAYVVAAGEPPTTSELRRFLADRLPEPMVPAIFVPLPVLPLTGSGKVDRRALPKPGGERPSLEREYVPPASDVEEALAEIWAEFLKIARVGVQDNFFELGGHSLLATQVITRIRERLRVDVPLIALFQMPTVEQLAVLIEEKILDALEAPPEVTPLVKLQATGSRPPIFLVHAAGGLVHDFVNLAQRLDSDQPFYALQSPALVGGEHFASVPLMAAHYLEAVRSVQPRGPYRLGGYCVGGTVAFEMARQLRAAGEPTEPLLLFDSPGPPAEPPPPLDEAELLASYAFTYGNGAEVSADELRALPPKAWIDRVLERVRETGALDASFDAALLHRRWEVMKRNTRAILPFVPAGRLSLGAVLFRAVEQPDEFKGQPFLGWERWLEGPIEVVDVEGGHLDVFQEPGVEAAARELRDRTAVTAAV